jgi:hypothetical protein
MKESCGNILLNDTRAISYPRDVVLIMAQARKERKRAPAQNNKTKAE